MMAALLKTDSITLSNLLKGFAAISPATDFEVSGIAIDSRKVSPGKLFIAYREGYKFITDAINAGASAILVDSENLSGLTGLNIPVFHINNLNSNTGIIASRFYGNPSATMNVTGVTGTNGKTSISFILAQCLSTPEKPCGLLGSLGYGTVDTLDSGLTTTPDPETLQRLLFEMHNQDIDQVVMEVSSHSLNQYRVSGVNFDTAVFTNLGRDHLDYHGDIESYAASKKKFFSDYSLSNAVINIDDQLGQSIINNIDPKVNTIGYSLNPEVSASFASHRSIVSGQVVNHQIDGMTLKCNSPWGECTINSRLIGEFNAYNLLACIATMGMMQIPVKEISTRLSSIKPVPGRMECFGTESQPRVVVDYAHTPDAIALVLQVLKSHCRGKLLCVFGCGGERDKGKRALMGENASRFADEIILTNDNPRKEDPDSIIKDILNGIDNRQNLTIELDRKAAIKNAIKNASPADVVLIAGKGHESYQDIGGCRRDFSDQAVVRNILGGRE